MFFKRIIFSLLLVSFSCSFADKLDDIKRKEIIHVGVKYEHRPMGFINDVGKIDGFEIDLMKFISDRLNVSVKLHQVTSRDRIEMLNNGKIDIIIATMDKDLALNTLEVSKPYFFDKLAMLVHFDEKADELSDFSSRIVGTLNGEKSNSLLDKELKETRVIKFTEYPQAMRSFKRKNIIAILADKVWCEHKAKVSHGKYIVLNIKNEELNYVMGVKKGEKRLLEELNKAIEASVTEGIYEEIYDKWFFKKPVLLP